MNEVRTEATPEQQQDGEPEVTGWDIEPIEDLPVEDDVEFATIEELRADVEELSRALRVIANIDPSTIKIGGPGNGHFGKKIIVAFEKAKKTALAAHYEQQARDYVRLQRAEQDQDEAPAES